MNRTSRRKPRRLLAAAALGLCLLPAAADASTDPLEPINRGIHRFNQVVQARILRPLADFYVAHTTEDVRRGVGNAIANLTEPLNLVSGLAAADVDVALNAAARFSINSTLGLAGLFDPASALGFPSRPYDLGIAACSWGVPSGPYMVLPLLGPSTLRDAGALAATSAALVNTLGVDSVLAWRSGSAVVGYTELRPELSRIERQSLDPYAVYRSAYLQRRAARCDLDRDRLLAEQAAEAEEEMEPLREVSAGD